MESVCICHGCNRTINKEYIYCPWCGMCRMEAEDKYSMDDVFSKLETIASNNRSMRITHMKNQLDSIQSELDSIVLSSETKND